MLEVPIQLHSYTIYTIVINCRALHTYSALQAGCHRLTVVGNTPKASWFAMNIDYCCTLFFMSQKSVDCWCVVPDGTMYNQGCNCYYGPLYGQGLALDYPPGCHQVASQWQPVNTVTLDTGTGTRSSSSQNEPSFLASVTLKVINPANKKNMKKFYWDVHVMQRHHKNLERRLWNNMDTSCHIQMILKFGIFKDNRRYG